MERAQSGTNLRQTRASSILRVRVTPSPTVWMDTGSPPRYRTQTYQLLSTLNPTRSLSGLLVSYTNYLTPPQTTSAANLKLHTNLSSNPDTHPVSTSINPPKFHPHPSGTKSFDSVSCILLLRKDTVIWPKYSFSFSFVSSLYVLSTLTCGLDDALVSLRWCRSVPLPFLFVSCLWRFFLLYCTYK